MRKVFAVGVLLMILPVVAFAQSNPCTLSGLAANANPQLGQCVSQIYLWALGAAGVLGIIMAIIGGYMVMTASGNASRAATGKSYLLSSIIGLIILMGAYLILYTINPDLVDFSTPSLNCLNTPTPPSCLTQ